MRKWEKIVLVVSLLALSTCLLFTLLRAACESPTEIVIIEKGLASAELRINLNRAEWAEIALLPGIGEKRAKDIVRKRQELGSLSAPDIAPLIGEKTLKKVENYITFSD